MEEDDIPQVPGLGVPAQEDVPRIGRVSIKVPPFWRANPRLWFRQIESQFFNAGITNDATKYHTLVGAISSDVLSQVSDIILDPPTQNMYETLRCRLEERFTDSEEKQLRKLLSELELVDKRPTQLLREMRDLSAGRVSDAILRSLWLQRLPTQAQAILTCSTDELNKLATMADKILEITPSPHVNATHIPAPEIQTSTCHSRTKESSAIQQLSEQMAEVLRRLDNMERSSRPQGTSFNSRSRSRSPGARLKSHVNGVCKWHTRYGDKAFNCILPCSYNSSFSTQAENDQGRR
uniref:Mitochondrial group I intron splicing factor CCM1 n=1 Tax=Lygus hesperus TaxID=30085 RepID=A0A0A9YNN7_LYGHE